MSIGQVWSGCGSALLVLALAGSASGQAADAVAKRAAKGGRLTIALIAEDHTQKNAWTKPFMAAAFEDKLLSAGRFKVLSRSELDAVMAEQKISTSGFVDPAQAVKIGKAAAANYVIVIKQIGMEQRKVSLPPGTAVTLNLQAQVIDTESSELVASESFSKAYKLGGWKDFLGSDSKAPQEPAVTEPYRAAIGEFATSFTTKVAATVPLDAIVAAVSGARVAITGGAELGLREGTEFEIIEEGEPIKVGTEIVGYNSRRVARVRVTKVDPKLAWTTVVKTFDDSEKEDAVPMPAKIKQGFLARMVQTAK